MNHLVETNIEVYAHQTAKEGKSHCGDSYYFVATEEYFVCVLADGLGSGQHAYEASHAVVLAVEKNHHENVETLMKFCNDALANKRGAAVSVLKVYFHAREFVYSCVGNIRFFLYSSKGKLTYPLPVTGYLSGKPQTYHTQRFSYDPHSKFLIFSDGYEFQGVKALLKGLFPVTMIADEIKRKYPTKSDDATFIIGSLH